MYSKEERVMSTQRFPPNQLQIYEETHFNENARIGLLHEANY
jgi:hypothetical protein